MLRFWKFLSIVLFATCIVSGVLAFSLFWWPNIPSSPRPEEGRIYPLNNHGHYTYMNSSEWYILEFALNGTPILLLTFAAIQYLVDPFGEIRKKRKYGTKPRGFL
jgi:hypothetical protein